MTVASPRPAAVIPNEVRDLWGTKDPSLRSG
jgi:hypothetical protein